MNCNTWIHYKCEKLSKSDIKYFKQTPSELYTFMVCMDLLANLLSSICSKYIVSDTHIFFLSRGTMFEHFLFRIDDDLYTCMVCMDLLMFDSYNRDNTNIEIIQTSPDIAITKDKQSNVQTSPDIVITKNKQSRCKSLLGPL
jgi:hypothetical protein